MNLADALAPARAGLTAPLAGYLAHPPAAEYRDAWVAEVLAALSDEGFEREHRGRRLEALAIEAVLACGYPWALRITPDQLELLRNEHGRRSPWLAVAVVAIILTSSCLLLGLMLRAPH